MLAHWKKTSLILLLSPTLCFAGFWQNHNGILYWIDDNGMWYARGKANLALSDPMPSICPLKAMKLDSRLGPKDTQTQAADALLPTF